MTKTTFNGGRRPGGCFIQRSTRAASSGQTSGQKVSRKKGGIGWPTIGLGEGTALVGNSAEVAADAPATGFSAVLACDCGCGAALRSATRIYARRSPRPRPEPTGGAGCATTYDLALLQARRADSIASFAAGERIQNAPDGTVQRRYRSPHGSSPRRRGREHINPGGIVRSADSRGAVENPSTDQEHGGRLPKRDQRFTYVIGTSTSARSNAGRGLSYHEALRGD